jgi:hypothetical protein
LENLRPHQRDPRIIQEALTENEIPASDRRVKFVTLKAYEIRFCLRTGVTGEVDNQSTALAAKQPAHDCVGFSGFFNSRGCDKDSIR